MCLGRTLHCGLRAETVSLWFSLWHRADTVVLGMKLWDKQWKGRRGYLKNLPSGGPEDPRDLPWATFQTIPFPLLVRLWDSKTEEDASGFPAGKSDSVKFKLRFLKYKVWAYA